MIPEIVTDRFGLLDLVHDRWFDLEQLAFDKTSRQVTLRLGENRKGPYDQKTLTVTDVAEISIQDDAQIGIYDLSDVQIGDSYVRLTSGMPLTINLAVGDGCKIHVRQGD
jgi:hypothetical protein